MTININFLEEINKISPITWIYKYDDSDTRHIGYLAEDLNQIDSFKYVVEKDKDSKPLGIKYDLLSIYAIEALKTAVQRIEILEKELNTLKSR